MDEKDITNSQVYVNDSLATFLTSSLNVELVHVILEAITKYTTSYEDPSLNPLDFLKDKNDKRFKEENKFSIDTIIIKNPEKWKVAKLDQFIEATQEITGTHHKTTIKRKVQKKSTVGEAMSRNQSEVFAEN